MKKIILMITLALLAGCQTFNTNYSRSKDIDTKSLAGNIPAASDENSDTLKPQSINDEIDVSKYFSDPELQNLLRRGLANNTDLLTAKLLCDEAEASLSAAKLAYYPSVSFSPEGGTSSFGGAKPSWTYSATVSAGWEADIFGSLKNSEKRSAAALAGSQYYALAVRTQLISTIAEYYYSLVMLDEQLKIYTETAQSWKDYVETVSALKESGSYTEAAVARAEANYDDVSASIIDIQKNIRETENRLSVLIGDSVHSIARGSFDNQNTTNKYENGIPLSRLSERPDVRRAEENLASCFYSVNIAKAAFYPTITLSGSAGWTNSAGGLIVNPGKFLWSALGSLTQPIFERGKLKSQLKISEAQQEEAKLNFRQTLLNAGMEVNNAYSQIQFYSAKDSLLAGRKDALVRAKAATDLLMQNGTGNYLEIISARQELLSAQLSVLNNSYNKIISMLNLDAALNVWK